MKFLNMLPLLALVSCGSATLAPQDERVVKFSEAVNADKATVYTSVMAFLAKNAGDANSAIKMQDKDAGMIIFKGNTPCDIFKQFGDTNDYFVQFNMTAKADNKLLKLSFEDLTMADKFGTPFRYDYGQITDSSKVEKVKECLLPIKKSILSSIN
jgi:hypothetical protein